MHKPSDHRVAILFHIRRYMPRPLGDFIVAESAGAMLLVTATILALIWANTGVFGDYASAWKGSHDFINEGLITVFFLVVGLEIKREFVKGELRDRSNALLPTLAAIGGMLVPALIYLSFNQSGPGARGWAIPMATDIVFAATVLTLLGKRVPTSLKLFLLVLAIVDDIGAIAVIGIFYSGSINPWYLLAGAIVLGLSLSLRRYAEHGPAIFIGLTALLWFCLHGAGVHASIAGAVMGLFVSFKPGAMGAPSVGERLETLLYPFATFIVIPVFALANAGVVFSGILFGNPTAQMVGLGVFAGLLFGKLIGVIGTSWLTIRLGLAKLPEGSTWRQMTGVACVAGIGFTVALFVADLSFPGDPHLQSMAKFSIVVASIAAAGLGALLLKRA